MHVCFKLGNTVSIVSLLWHCIAIKPVVAREIGEAGSNEAPSDKLWVVAIEKCDTERHLPLKSLPASTETHYKAASTASGSSSSWRPGLSAAETAETKAQSAGANLFILGLSEAEA